MTEPQPSIPLPPTTTIQEDIETSATREEKKRVTEGQRRINLIWEITQSLIAVIITSSVIYCVVNSISADVLTNAFFLIVSMYYVRTNHNLIGGVGYKPYGESR